VVANAVSVLAKDNVGVEFASATEGVATAKPEALVPWAGGKAGRERGTATGSRRDRRRVWDRHGVTRVLQCASPFVAAKDVVSGRARSLERDGHVQTSRETALEGDTRVDQAF
jgi:hypothetical protein